MESMTAPKKKKTTVEPLSPTLRENLLEMVAQVGTHAKVGEILHIGAGTLSNAIKNGAGRNLRQRLERNHASWARVHYGERDDVPGGPADPRGLRCRREERRAPRRVRSAVRSPGAKVRRPPGRFWTRPSRIQVGPFRS
ncbi:hypothetical protein LCGC14_2696270, partial [marine sediment metagenome]